MLDEVLEERIVFSETQLLVRFLANFPNLGPTLFLGKNLKAMLYLNKK